MLIEALAVTLACAQPESIEGPAAGTATKPPAKLIYHESTLRHRRQGILANADRLGSLPFDGITVNMPASWFAMTTDRWTYADSYDNWIAPIEPLLNDPANGLTDNYLVLQTDRPADFLEDWSVAVANVRDLAAIARDAGFVGIYFDNEEYQTPIWDWPSAVDTPSAGWAAYEAAARAKGRLIGEAMSDEFPDIRVIVLHGPYIADDSVPNSIRRNQFGVGSFELYGPFYAGMLEGLGDRATLIDGGEVYALRTEAEFRGHALWRRWGMSSDAHDVSFLNAADRHRHRTQTEISFGVYPLEFPVGSTMSPAILRTTLEAALRQSDSVAWFYSEEGMSPWEPTQFTAAWMDALIAAREAAADPAPRLRFGVDDVHRVHQQPFDADGTPQTLTVAFEHACLALD
ncbi:MAG: hypothetical protein AAFO89_14280, partial [Planctomycetota bacterium]